MKFLSVLTPPVFSEFKLNVVIAVFESKVNFILNWELGIH